MPPAPPSPAPARAPQGASRPRPEAPIFSFGPPIDAEEASGNRCDVCQSPNPPGYRFCITCGAALAQSAPQSGPSTPSSADNAVTPKTPPVNPAPKDTRKADDLIVGAPVVEIAASKPAPPKIIICTRCHGQSVLGTRFCKYCGAILEEPKARAPEESRAEDTIQAPSGAGRAWGRPAMETVPEFKTEAPASKREHPAPPAPPSPEALPGDEMNPLITAPRLVSISEDGSEGKSYPLSQTQVDIGRTEGDIILSDDLYVSPRHARLILEGAESGHAGEGRWILRDLNSTNHIYLRIRNPYPLQDGDLLLLGLEVLQFQLVNDSEKGLGHAIQHGTLLFGSPATPRRARLCQKTVEGIIRDVYHLHKDETVIGRETADIVFSADPFLSRRHAVLRIKAATGEYSLADLDSSNGTYVAVRGDTRLSHGDFFRIGQHLFRLDLA